MTANYCAIEKPAIGLKAKGATHTLVPGVSGFVYGSEEGCTAAEVETVNIEIEKAESRAGDGNRPTMMAEEEVHNQEQESVM
jgi:hypothetical protein